MTDQMKRLVQPFALEALDYPYDLARHVLDLFPDEWHTAAAVPVVLHPDGDSGPDCIRGECETGVYTPGNDGWILYDGDGEGSRYVRFMVPVHSLLNDEIRVEYLNKARWSFARAAEKALA